MKHIKAAQTLLQRQENAVREFLSGCDAVQKRELFSVNHCLP